MLPWGMRVLLPPPRKPPLLRTLAGKAKDLSALRDTVVDAASVGAGLWFSYVFVLLYFLISVGSIPRPFLGEPGQAAVPQCGPAAPRLLLARADHFPHRAYLCAFAFRLARGEGRRFRHGASDADGRRRRAKPPAPPAA